MTLQIKDPQIVHFGELKLCKTAFIDARTPGSDKKENFTIIGAGVSESREQHVHITETPGFNIGAAGQPPRCKNSMHSHTTAEVFFVLSGRWRFFWGLYGTAGEVVLGEGDIFNIPTGIFRGFENIGTDYGVIMAILGGDDAGGGVTWAPHVIRDAAAHGLILAETGRLYDTHNGELLPEDIQPMPLLSEAELKAYPETPVEKIIPNHVARYLDMMALSARKPCQVIGENALLKDQPGFEVEFLSRYSIPEVSYASDYHEILLIMRGHWLISWQGGKRLLAPGDTCAVPPGLDHKLRPGMSGEASLFRVCNTDKPLP